MCLLCCLFRIMCWIVPKKMKCCLVVNLNLAAVIIEKSLGVKVSREKVKESPLVLRGIVLLILIRSPQCHVIV